MQRHQLEDSDAEQNIREYRMVSYRDDAAVAAHLQHCSAEINSAIAEGMYVHMLAPLMMPRTDDEGNVFDVFFALQYEIVPRNHNRTILVDHRDEVSKRRSPDYEPPSAG